MIKLSPPRTTYCGCAEPVGACGTNLTDWCSYHVWHEGAGDTSPAAVERWQAHVDACALRWPAIAQAIIDLEGRL